jgi:hypothetical protein
MVVDLRIPWLRQGWRGVQRRDEIKASHEQFCSKNPVQADEDPRHPGRK